MTTRQSKKRVSNALLAGALVLGSGGVAMADQREASYFDDTADEAGEMPARELEDEALHRFIDAAHDVQSIRREYAERMRGASGEELPVLRAEAQERMAQAVESQGLEVADYREIGYLLENDRSLGGRLDRAAAGPDDA